MSNKIKQRIEKALQELLEELDRDRIQMFDCRDIMGDSKAVLLSLEEVKVLYAPEYNYVEILGLDEEDYNYFKEKYGY